MFTKRVVADLLELLVLASKSLLDHRKCYFPPTYMAECVSNYVGLHAGFDFQTHTKKKTVSGLKEL